MALTYRQERKRRIDALRALPLVAGCTRRQLGLIDQLGTRVDVGAGTTLTHEGTPGRECFVVLDGAADATRDGRRLGRLGAGTVAGELALLDGIARSATVVARSPMRLVVLTPLEFTDLLEVAPCVEDGVHAIAAQRRAALELVDAR
jgi:CRP-like cAMP-binding protein